MGTTSQLNFFSSLQQYASWIARASAFSSHVCIGVRQHAWTPDCYEPRSRQRQRRSAALHSSYIAAKTCRLHNSHQPSNKESRRQELVTALRVRAVGRARRVQGRSSATTWACAELYSHPL
eukprot:5966714-Pleurochrysis_carterae.AAC.4